MIATGLMCRASSVVVAFVSLVHPIAAASPSDVNGLWMTQAKDAVLEIKSCGNKAGAICGRIVWDKDAGGATDTCGARILQLGHFDGDAWRDGWIYDPRDKKNYKGKVTVSGSTLTMRAFVGVEVLGQSETFSRTSAVPASPICRK